MTVSGKSAEAISSRPEVELLLACARTSLDAATTARLTALLQTDLDWDLLLRLAQRHRIIPSMYRHLTAPRSASVPAEFRDRLQNHFYVNAARNHRLAAELCAVLQLFAEHSLAVVPFKGPVLAQALYGDITLRQFSDLDVLVHRRDIARAAALLEKLNYRRQHQLTPAQEAAFQRSECEHLFSRPAEGLHLDLHWQFVPRYFSLRFDAESCWPRLAESSFEGQPILTFGPEDTLLILAVHAAKEGWERLVWLCDLAELIRLHPQLDWPQVLERARLSGTRRMLLTGLALTRELPGTRLSAGIEQAIAADGAVPALTARIKQQLFQTTIEPAGIARFVLPNRALERRRDRIKFRLRLALTPSPEDWAFARVPERLHFLYHLLRPVRLACKYLPNR